MRTGTWRQRSFQLVLALCVLSGAGAVTRSIQQALLQRRAIQTAKQTAKKIAVEQAAAINHRMAKLTPIAEEIARDLSSGALSVEQVRTRLKDALRNNADVFEAGIAYAPFARDPAVQLFAPHVARDGLSITDFQLEQRYEYQNYEWYKDGMAAGRPHWGEPYLGGATHTLVVGYSVPFYRPGDASRTPIGLVRTNLSLDQIHKIVASLSIGQTGYAFLLSRKGVFLSDPVEDYVRDQKTIFDVASLRQDEGRRQLGEKAIKGLPAEQESVSGVTGQATWIFSEPIASPGWSLGTVFMQGEMAVEPLIIRRGLTQIACFWILFLLFLAALWFWKHEATDQSLWNVVIVTAGVLVAGISLIWWLTLRYPDRNGEVGVHIYDLASLQTFLSQRQRSLESTDSMVQVKTGIFIRTMRFGTANDVTLTGQVWERFTSDASGRFTPGFNLQDAESFELKEAYHTKDKAQEVVGWDFKTTLREPFRGAIKYPFDRPIVRIRITPKGFYRNLVMTPDLESYQLLSPSSLPGVDKDLVLPGWQLDQSYFIYSPEDIGTNFGVDVSLEQKKPFELGFTVIAQRQFLDPFISSVLPIIVVACLLFGLLIVGTKQAAKVAATGFKATDVVRAGVALLFPVLLAQVNLRTKIGSSTIIYIEYFYFVLYTAILGVAANALLFTLKGHGFSQYRDNLIPKLIFWPCLLGACFVVTLSFLY